MVKYGRTKRKRRLKRTTKTVAIKSSHEKCYVDLMIWAESYGFKKNSCNKLCPAIFCNIGRGLMALQHIQKHDLIIAIPENMLITTQTALKDTEFAKTIKRFRPLSPIQVLCLYLIYQRYLGLASAWYPYIQTLPLVYSTPVYYTQSELLYLPLDIRWKAESMRNRILEEYNQLSSVILQMRKQPLFKDLNAFNYDSFVWAWHVVNTRSVFMMQPKSALLTDDVDHYALAPFLDLLNHSSTVQVQAKFNVVTRCYEIRSLDMIQRYSQVFICYGPHDNARLLLEYGFILPNNLHNVVLFSQEEVFVVNKEFSVEAWDKKLLLLKEYALRDFNCSMDGVSWDLLKACHIFILDFQHLKLWNLHIESDVNVEPIRTILHFLVSSKLKFIQNILSELSCKERSSHEDMIKQLYEQYKAIILHNLDIVSMTCGST